MDKDLFPILALAAGAFLLSRLLAEEKKPPVKLPPEPTRCTRIGFISRLVGERERQIMKRAEAMEAGGFVAHMVPTGRIDVTGNPEQGVWMCPRGAKPPTKG